MRRLSQIGTGNTCRVTWMLGRTAAGLKAFTGIDTDSFVRVVCNAGSGGMIVRSGGRTFAMDEASASVIRVEAV